MDLQDILLDAGAGFIGGFSLGLSGLTGRFKEKIEFREAMESILEEETTEDRLTSYRKDYTKRDLQAIQEYPALISIVYSSFSSVIFPHNGTTLENLAASLPAAYLGSFTGRMVRKLIKKRDKKNGLELARQIKENPEGALYHLSAEDRKSFGEVIKEIRETDLEIEAKESLSGYNSLDEFFLDLISRKKRYAPEILGWVLSQARTAIKANSLQRRLADFYEPDDGVSRAQVIGTPPKCDLKVCELSEGKLAVRSTRVTNFRLVDNQITRTTNATIEDLEMDLDYTRKWDGDYTQLADDLIRQSKNHSIVLVRRYSDIPNVLTKDMVSEAFIAACTNHLLRKTLE